MTSSARSNLITIEEVCGWSGISSPHIFIDFSICCKSFVSQCIGLCHLDSTKTVSILKRRENSKTYPSFVAEKYGLLVFNKGPKDFSHVNHKNIIRLEEDLIFQV